MISKACKSTLLEYKADNVAKIKNIYYKNRKNNIKVGISRCADTVHGKGVLTAFAVGTPFPCNDSAVCAHRSRVNSLLQARGRGQTVCAPCGKMGVREQGAPTGLSSGSSGDLPPPGSVHLVRGALRGISAWFCPSY